MRYLRYGKDRISEPCIEMDDGSAIPLGELLQAYLKEKGGSKGITYDAESLVFELPLCQHLARITALNPSEARPVNATITYNEVDFPVTCFVTQDLVDAYVAGELVVGDYVVISFLEGQEDKPLASEKIYKSW